ncbi:hypothetical protein M0R45_025863 [Rubus argutus]|uniref:Uncharacterized protein n=1 Tax=Rubus argutus TaxID=59490 RepID=A0AAW1WZ79_RUBAR
MRNQQIQNLPKPHPIPNCPPCSLISAISTITPHHLLQSQTCRTARNLTSNLQLKPHRELQPAAPSITHSAESHHLCRCRRSRRGAQTPKPSQRRQSPSRAAPCYWRRQKKKKKRMKRRARDYDRRERKDEKKEKKKREAIPPPVYLPIVDRTQPCHQSSAAPPQTGAISVKPRPLFLLYRRRFRALPTNHRRTLFIDPNPRPHHRAHLAAAAPFHRSLPAEE